MAFERYVHHISCVSFQRSRESSKRNKYDATAVLLTPGFGSTSAKLNKGTKVRIVLASGMVEVYDGVTPASTVMEKYPGLCLTRPDVFKRPHDSLVGRKEMLLPGQKFYLVPETTMKKVRENYLTKTKRGEAADSNKKEERKCDGETAQQHICSAKDFYTSNDKWTLCCRRRLMEEAKKREKQNRRFRPPIKSIRMRQGLLDGWSPSLPTVVEEVSQ
ncbi:uncharacterized protein M6B38_156685 [Iris pallida]|uniref:Uncharacterized protein n=1 Tax=Iris pallida TaxID=29817 RepID=A0AAX6F2U2_IRIPA|nr:uncharacterized protein M6B38_156685 [Iris pallida]